MKNTIRFLALLMSLFLLSSCFEILEKVSITNSGSGDYSIVINASKSKTRIESIRKLGTFNGKKIPQKEELVKKINEATKVFKTTPGISNVVSSIDEKNYIMKLSCKFQKIENINAGLQALKTKKIIGSEIPTDIYSHQCKTKTLVRKKINTFKNNYINLPKAEKEIFSTAKFVSVLQLESPIKKQTNNQYSISPQKKALKLEGNVLDFILEKKTIENTINY